MKLSVAHIVCSTSVDGVGLRNSLYVSGCPIHCPDCHNKNLWDIKSGIEKDVEEVFDELCKDGCNISILGGEPMMQYPAIVELCRMIKSKTNKTIWIWSGYTIEYIKEMYPEILNLVDVLVDGPYKKEFANNNLLWRGSSNQRVIYLK